MAAISSDTTIANEKIISLLGDAGVDGLHVDDILYLLGFKTKKELVPRLNELKNKKAIVDLDGDRWKKSPEATNTTNEKKASLAETYVEPTSKGDLPQIKLPGEEKFSSYKNSLQEYCHKLHCATPQYKAVPENNGLVGTVTFSTNIVKSAEVAGSVKEADSRVAFEALKSLGYLQNATFECTPNQLKRKDTGPVDGDTATSNTAAKQIKTDGASFKSKLNELAQKKKLPMPTYDSVSVNGGYFATANFNETKFKGSATCKKRKDAEQNAAQVALHELTGTPMPSDEPMAIGEEDVSKMVSEARSKASQPTSLKNRLQEYCQRLGKLLPAYETKLNDSDKTFQSTVTVDGQSYDSAFINGKKNAETAAAEVALKALKLMV